MKLSNSAITMLMAAYRAIFKNAYYKGLVGAALVTASVGVASATVGNIEFGNISNDQQIIISGKQSELGKDEHELFVVKNGRDNSNNFTVKFTGNSERGSNTITSGTVNAKNATFEISNANENGKASLTIGDGTSAAALNVKQFNIVQGTLTIKGNNSSNTASLNADTITIGSSGATNVAETGKVQLNEHGTLGRAAAAGVTASTTTLYKDGVIKFGDASTSGGTLVGKLDGKGGSFVFASGGTVKAWGENQNLKIAVNPSATATLSLEDIKETDDNEGLLHISEGTIDIQTKQSATGGDATLIVSKGILKLDDTVELVSKKSDSGENPSKGILQVGSGTNTAKLEISSKTLKGFVSGGTSAAKGAVDLKAKGAIRFTDKDFKATTFTYAADTAAAGKLAVTQGGKISAHNITIDDALEGATNAIFKADDKLTLGSSTFDGDEAIGVAELRAKNLDIASTAFTLQDKLTLSSVGKTVTSGSQTIIPAESGTITGDLTVSGGATKGLIIDGGNYTADGTITVASGTLTVKNTQSATASTLNLNTLKFDGSSDNSVLVSGAETALTIGDLDISSLEDAAVSSTIKASAGGTINISAADVQEVLTRAEELTADTEHKVKFEIGGASDAGTLNITSGSITLNRTTNEASTAPKDYVGAVLDVKAYGIVNVDGLTVNTKNDDAGKTSYSTSGTFNVNTLTLNAFKANGTDKHDAVDLTKGTFNVASKLSSSNATLNISGATVTLGQAQLVEGQKYYTGVSGGSIDVATLKVSKDVSNKDALAIETGTWTAKAIDVTAGKVSVGTDIAKLDKDGNALSASLTANDLKIGAAGKVTVNQGSSLTTTTLNTATPSDTNGLFVYGTMTVNGNDVNSTNVGDGSLAVVTAANSITVGSNATLEFGNLAVMNSIYGGSGENNTINLVENGLAENSINLDHNGTVKLNFTSGTNFTSKQLTDLKKKLFSNDVDGKINGVLNIGKATIAGLNIGSEIKFNELNENQGVQSDVTNDALSSVKVTEVGTTSEFAYHVGSAQLATGASTVNVTGNSSFSNAQGNGGLFVSKVEGGKTVAADATVKNGSYLNLNNGGEIANVTLDTGSSLVVKGGDTVIASVKGTSGNFVANANTKVTADVNVKDISNAANTALTVDGGDLKAAGNANFAGDVTVSSGTFSASGDTTFAGNTQISGAATVTGDLEVSGVADFGGGLKVTSGKATFTGNTTVSGDATVGGGDLIVANNSTFKAKSINLSGSTQTIYVGSQQVEGIPTSKDSSGLVIAKNINLKGGTIFADPDWNEKASMVLAGYLGSEPTAAPKTAGTLSGSLIAGRNSIIAVGVADEKNGDVVTTALQLMEDNILPYLVDSNGSLQQEDGVGAAAFVAKHLEVQNGSKIIVNPEEKYTTYHDPSFANKYTDYSVYLASGGALLVDEDAFTDDQGKPAAAISFAQNSTVHGENNSKIILTGSSIGYGDYQIFGNATISSQDTKGIAVESLNGLFTGVLSDGTSGTTKLSFDPSRAKHAYVDATAPVRDTLLAYSAKDADWQNIVKIVDDKPHDQISLHNGNASDEAEVKGNEIVPVAGNTDPNFNSNNYVIVTEKDGTKVAYHKANNAFLDRITQNAENKGHDADTAARLGAFGGAAQAALAASSVVSDTIAARLGVSASANVTAATNGVSSLWVTPVYKAANSDGFGADNMNYGADVSLYGLALGGDYTLASGLKFGAMFNVGSGDADGNGIGRDVSNDFDFYGFGIYGGFAQGPFSIIGDISYSVVDNDLKGNIVGGKLTSSMDSSALSLGVTGQYELNMGTFSVTPHAGLRYTKIDLDDYTVKSDVAGDGEVGAVDSSNVSVFSIPVGVTFAKTMVSGEWTFKPMLDLTVAANFGDDTVDATMNWNGMQNKVTKYSNEFIDGFTYGATAGVELSSQSFSLGIGVNYNRSSNTDGYGINANARFVF